MGKGQNTTEPQNEKMSKDQTISGMCMVPSCKFDNFVSAPRSLCPYGHWSLLADWQALISKSKSKKKGCPTPQTCSLSYINQLKIVIWRSNMYSRFADAHLGLLVYIFLSISFLYPLLKDVGSKIFFEVMEVWCSNQNLKKGHHTICLSFIMDTS